MKHIWLKFSIGLLGMLAILPAWALTAEPAKLLWRAKNPVRDEYIVVLDPALDRGAVRGIATSLVEAADGELIAVFEHGLLGFGARMPQQKALALLRNPHVHWIEENQTGSFSGIDTNPYWHLDRIDQRGAVSAGDGVYSWTTDGAGVEIYIVDSGVMRAHTEFLDGEGGSRVSTEGLNKTEDIGDLSPAHEPCTLKQGEPLVGGHGTAVASVAAGNTFGVAREASIIPVKVAPCGGGPDLLRTIWSLDWILAERNRKPSTPAVVNMSIYFYGKDAACQYPLGSFPRQECRECYDANGDAIRCNCVSREGEPYDCRNALEYNITNLLVSGVTVVASANNFNSIGVVTQPTPLFPKALPAWAMADIMATLTGPSASLRWAPRQGWNTED